MLSSGKPIEMPQYTHATCARSENTVTVEPTAVIILEGILIFTHAELRKRFSVRAFVDAEQDERLIRILRRDILERGRDIEAVLAHYNKFVKPMHYQFIEPTKRYADIIIPQGGENHVAIEILASRIKTIL
jgi:uridine kinase